MSKNGRGLQNTSNKIIKTFRPNEILKIDLIERIFKENCENNKFIAVAIDHLQNGLKK